MTEEYHRRDAREGGAPRSPYSPEPHFRDSSKPSTAPPIFEGGRAGGASSSGSRAEPRGDRLAALQALQQYVSPPPIGAGADRRSLESGPSRGSAGAMQQSPRVLSERASSFGSGNRNRDRLAISMDSRARDPRGDSFRENATPSLSQRSLVDHLSPAALSRSPRPPVGVPSVDPGYNERRLGHPRSHQVGGDPRSPREDSESFSRRRGDYEGESRSGHTGDRDVRDGIVVPLSIQSCDIF